MKAVSLKIIIQLGTGASTGGRTQEAKPVRGVNP